MNSDDFSDDLDEAVMNEIIALEDAHQQIPSHSKTAVQPDSHHLKILLKYFGHESFRPLQWEIISSILEFKRDVCAVMATGYGKSLCFQYPSVYKGGITLVISPLISLMEDQVLSLKVSNIPACLLGTAQKKQNDVIDKIFMDEYRLIYATPEFCTGEFGENLFKRISQEQSVVLIAIDEAHCISSWGHDFRSQYRKLGVLRNVFPNVPIIAVTATATEKVRSDIVKSLNLYNPLQVCSGFNRPNLYFEVFVKGSGGVYKDMTRVMVYDNGNYKFSGPTIVYCITRKQSEEIAQHLKISGINCCVYHAGLSLNERKEAHELFVRDKVDVIVATIAFGMGIDKPDVRNVIHYGSSKSIENYYQEVGRAGRDGAPSRCVTFYSSSDFTILRKLEGISQSSRNKDALTVIESYFTTRECRRTFILEYFADKLNNSEKARTNCCDNCTKKLYDNRSDHEIYDGVDDKGCYDFSKDALFWLQTVSIMGSSFGQGTYILFLRGSKSSKVRQNFQKHELFGCGKGQPEEWWKGVGRILIKEGYLQEKNEHGKGYTYTAIKPTEKGQILRRQLENKERQLLLPPPSSVLKFLKKKQQTNVGWLTTKSAAVFSSTSTTTKEDTSKTTNETETEIVERMTLYRKLLNERTEIARQLDCMPYMVAPNATLMAISRHKPRNLDELSRLNLEGFTETKLQKFGDRFLKVSGAEPSNKKLTIRNILATNPLPNASLGLSAETSCTMFAWGLTVGEIAEKRSVKFETITSHLISGIKAGYPIKMIELGVSDECRDSILSVYKKLSSKGSNSDVKLSEMKDNCCPDITYDQIKTVLTYLQVRSHLNNLKTDYEEFEDFSFNEISQLGEDKADDKLEELLVTCEEVQRYIGVDNTDVSTEPVAKKVKTETTDCDLNAILDSPPRKYGTVSNNQKDCDSPSKIYNAVKKVPQKALPPWLTKKKVN